MKQKIIDGAERLFFQYGVRSVSMDDVARELSVSKKTLYQYFENKDQLVLEVTKQRMLQEVHQYETIPSHAANAIEELSMISKCLKATVRHLNPSMLYDLQKYHNEAWNVFLDFKQGFIRGTISDNILRGKTEGYYRPEINEHILSILRVEIIQLTFDERIFPQEEFDFTEVQMQIFDVFVHGLLTEKGKQLYNQYIHSEAKQLHT